MIQGLGQLLQTARVFVSEQEGATATEYAVILTLIIATVAGAAALLGGTVSGTTSAVYNGLSTGTDAGGTFFEAGSFRNHITVNNP